jgi:hypothetical protein
MSKLKILPRYLKLSPIGVAGICAAFMLMLAIFKQG